MELPRDNNLYIACIDLRDRPVVVVGAGAVALEKIDSLLHSGAKVTVVAPDAIHEVRALAERSRIAWVRRQYETSDLDGALLAIVATGVDTVARNVHADAEARGLLVNVADVPELCTFILPAVVREGPIAVAISTAGASPALAQRLRDEIGALLKRPYSALARLLHELRPWAKASLPTYEARKDFFNDIVRGDPDPLSLLEVGRDEELHERVASVQRRALNAADR